MIIAIIATLIALVTAIIAVIAAQEVITDPKKLGWNKLNTKGYWVIVCAILMVLLPFGQFYFQNRQDEQKETERKTEQSQHDRELRNDYEASVNRMKQEYNTSVVRQQNSYQTSVAEQRTEYAASADKRILAHLKMELRR
jgi:hypothetical protein